MSARRGARSGADTFGEQLWPLPAAAVVVAVVLGVGMPELDERVVDELPPRLTGYLFSGGPEPARGVLTTVAGSLITVTSLTFSITIVALQLASSQYSPRLLRTFTRDRVVHVTLAVLLGTFTYALTVLRTVRTATDEQAQFVPQLSVTIAYLLALVSVVFVVVFLAHLAQKIRIESTLRDVHADTSRTLRRELPERAGGPDLASGWSPPAGPGQVVCAKTSGFLTFIDQGALKDAAERADAVISVDRLPGDSIIEGTPIATVWARGGEQHGGRALSGVALANSVAEAEAMASAATAAREQGLRAMCGFNYRRVPAVSLMAQLVAAGRIGTIRHVRATYLQDWVVDPQFPLVWRLRKEIARSGALGDIGSHIIDITQFITGQRITRVSALMETFITRRPLPDSAKGLEAANPDGDTGTVTVDDAAVFLARLDGGAIATYEATRFATGRRNGLRVEINGSHGSVAFDLERLNELEFHDATVPEAERGFRRILVTERSHPYMSAWWPPGAIIGYEHTFTHQARDLIEAIATGTDPRPSFADALQVQRVLDAVERSAASGAWAEVPG